MNQKSDRQWVQELRAAKLAREEVCPVGEKKDWPRNLEIIDLVRKGRSLRRVGKKFKISTARVGQIVKVQIEREERHGQYKKARALFLAFHHAKILQNLQVTVHAMTLIIEPYVKRDDTGDSDSTTTP